MVAIAITLSIGTTAASARTGEESAAPSAEPSLERKAKPACPYARLGVAYYRGRFTHWQLQRGAPIPTWRKPRNCADARYLATVWAKRAHVSKVATRKHVAEIARRTLKDFEVYPGNHAWLKAVDEVQKAYPGTKGWLISCSWSEGRHGRWVGFGGVPPSASYHGVGGWMQMLPGTWSTMFYGWHSNEGALSYLKRQGFIVPRSAHSWYSALGQALASAHGKLNGRGGEWHGSGC